LDQLTDLGPNGLSFPGQRISETYATTSEDDPIDVRFHGSQLFLQALECFFFHHVYIIGGLPGKDKLDNGEPEGRGNGAVV
jgi:hypothetical protein